MWQLIQNHSCLLMRQRLLPVKSNTYFINVIKNQPSKVVKRYFSEVKTSPSKSDKSSIFLICSPWKLCAGVSIGLGARLLLENGVAYCKAGQSRTVQRRPNLNEDSAKFDWQRFFTYLKPHKWLCVAAVASALAVAFLNVYIPAMLGVIVNVLANMKSSQQDFMEQIKLPAIKLITLYIGQAAFTFFYIHLLSQIGEKVAAQMKQDLFVNILNQDMAFFDLERTGELVNRQHLHFSTFTCCLK